MPHQKRNLQLKDLSAEPRAQLKKETLFSSVSGTLKKLTIVTCWSQHSEIELVIAEIHIIIKEDIKDGPSALRSKTVTLEAETKNLDQSV